MKECWKESREILFKELRNESLKILGGISKGNLIKINVEMPGGIKEGILGGFL